jgi:hypothetical protein
MAKKAGKFSLWRGRIRKELSGIFLTRSAHIPRGTRWATREAFDEGVSYQDAALAIAKEAVNYIG